MNNQDYNGVARQYPQRSKFSLPPDAKGRNRRWHHHGDELIMVIVRVPYNHPLCTANGWVSEGRVAAFEAGMKVYPGDRVMFLNGDRTDCTPSNLVIHRPGDPWPLPVKVYLCKCGCGRKPKWRSGYFDKSCWKINDEFSKLTHLSRQRQLQLRWRAEGKCTQCGGEPLVSRNHCRKCRLKAQKRAREKYQRDPVWRKKAKEYSKEYHRANPGYNRIYAEYRYHMGIGKKQWPEDVQRKFKEEVAAI